MAEVTSELIYELMKKIHQRMDRFDSAMGEFRQEMVSMRLAQMGMQTDIHNIYGITARIDERLERIEHRLELHEFAETQSPYKPE